MMVKRVNCLRRRESCFAAQLLSIAHFKRFSLFRKAVFNKIRSFSWNFDSRLKKKLIKRIGDVE
jgi:hypothetical protein